MSALLAGLEEEAESFDARGCACFIGTSAGSIVAAALAAGVAPGERLGEVGASPPAADPEPSGVATPLAQTLGVAMGLGSAAAAPLASFAFGSTVGGGALLRRAVLRGIRPGRRSLGPLREIVERSGARWDGRLRIAAVEVESGRRVMFGDPDAPAVSVASAVCASCAIPGVFEPVREGGRTYVDGGVWSPTNMDAAAIERGDSVLCLNPTGSLRRSVRGLGPMSRGVSAGEALALRHRGATVTTINPDEATAVLMGANLMDPSRRPAVIGAGLAQGRRLAASVRDRAA